MAHADDILHPSFAGTIVLKDSSGHVIGEFDVEPAVEPDAIQGHRIFLGEQCWQVDGTREDRPIVLGTGGGMQAVFYFERHPDGNEFAIRSSDGHYVFRDIWVRWVWTQRSWDQMRADRPEPKKWGRFSVTVKKSNREALLQRVAPCYQSFLDNPAQWVVESLRRVRGDQGGCTIAAVGTPGSGKSTLWNAWASVVALQLAILVAAGGKANAKGHLTLQQRRHALIREACSQCGFTAPLDIELLVADLVGMRCERELECALLGKTRSGELWPTDRRSVEGELLSQGEVATAINAIERRRTSPHDAAHFVLLLVTANAILELAKGREPQPENSAPTAPESRSARELTDMILSVTRRYKANVPRSRHEQVRPLPLHLVVTKADKWAVKFGFRNPRALLGGSEGVFRPLYDAAFETLGLPASAVTVIGWMDDPEFPVDYTCGTDPRVVVMKHLMCHAAQHGCHYASSLPVP